jgi:RhoGAP domain
MEVLFAFLNWTSSFSHVDEDSGSKMDIHNLATVMTPNVLYSRNSAVEESFLAIEAVNTLITYNDTMCEVGASLITRFWVSHLKLNPHRFQRIYSQFSMMPASSRIAPRSLQKR